MKKKHLKKIKDIAAALPIIMNVTKEKHIISGKELIEQNITEINGVKVLPDQKYIQEMPVHIASNHKNAIKNILKRGGGVKEVNKYIEQQINYVKNQNQSL